MFSSVGPFWYMVYGIWYVVYGMKMAFIVYSHMFCVCHVVHLFLVLKEIENGKACGPDNIPIEAFKNLNKTFMVILKDRSKTISNKECCRQPECDAHKTYANTL